MRFVSPEQLAQIARVHFVIRCEACGVEVGTPPREPGRDVLEAALIELRLVQGAKQELGRMGCSHTDQLMRVVAQAAHTHGSSFFFARVR